VKSRKWFWFIFTVFFILITPLMFNLADLERGYNAIGGELFVPFIPLMTLAVKESIKDMREDVENE